MLLLMVVQLGIVLALTNVPATKMFSQNKSFAHKNQCCITKNTSQTVRARSQRLSSSVTFIVTITDAHANGFPPMLLHTMTSYQYNQARFSSPLYPEPNNNTRPVPSVQADVEEQFLP
ncbi:unnamed protein product [Rotaria sp. Silwood2]|nr:unnamed protein product [Rotaria sp. Silwood2]CAF4466672.1 unnamed protein product [Rotaria sp. Silwood2]